MDPNTLGILILSFIVALFLLRGIKIIRPTHVAAVETLGKYKYFKRSGITYVIPLLQKLYKVNITEQLIDVKRQDVITKDNLNCTVDAQIYFRVGRPISSKNDKSLNAERVIEQDLKSALYHVNDYERQIVQLARTTLRNVIGAEDFKEVNANREKLNTAIFKSINGETNDWGIHTVRVELKEVQPPIDVQETMNTVIKAQNEKDAALDFATAEETKADGEKRAAIKIAEGDRKSQALRADGEAKAIIAVAQARATEIKLVNNSASEHFKGNAKLYEALKVTRDTLSENTKFVVTTNGISPSLIFNTDSGIVPIKDIKEPKKAKKQKRPTKTD